MVKKIGLGILASTLFFSNVNATDTELKAGCNADNIKAEVSLKENNQTSAKSAVMSYRINDLLKFGGELGLKRALVAEGQGHSISGYCGIGYESTNLELFPGHSMFEVRDSLQNDENETNQIAAKFNFRTKQNKINLMHQARAITDEEESLTVRNSVSNTTNINYEFLNKKLDAGLTLTRRLNQIESRKYRETESWQAQATFYRYLLPGLGMDIDVDYRWEDHDQSVDAGALFDIITNNKTTTVGMRYLGEYPGGYLGKEVMSVITGFEYGKDAIKSKMLERNRDRKLAEYKGMVQEGYRVKDQIIEEHEDKKAKLDLPLSIMLEAGKSFGGEEDVQLIAKGMLGFKSAKAFGSYSYLPFEAEPSEKWSAGFYVNAKALQIRAQYENFLSRMFGYDRFSIKLNYGGGLE